MSTFEQRAAQRGFVPVSQSSIDERLTFIRKTYAHLLGAVVAFGAISFGILQQPSFIGRVMFWLFDMGSWGAYAWLIVLGLFSLVGFVADWWANNMESRLLQYLGLGLYVVAEALIFTPMIFLAQDTEGVGAAASLITLPAASLITSVLFAGLTVAVFATKKDFSFLRTGIIAASFLAMVVLAGAVFGFSLGLWFSVAMVVLAGASILYYTSNVLHHYRPQQYVAASLALFSALALLFWYVIRVVLAFTSD